MSAKTVDDVLQVLGEGYSRYLGETDPGVYDRLPCGKTAAEAALAAEGSEQDGLLAPFSSRPRRRARRREPSWFSKLERGRLRVLCLGCESRCALIDPSGFQLLLPTPAPAGRVAFASLSMIHPRELLRAKEWLRPDEAAWCLSVSERHVRDLVDEGKLTRHPDLPLRVTAESVADEMNRRALS